jgi:hypothetical protein
MLSHDLHVNVYTSYSDKDESNRLLAMAGRVKINAKALKKQFLDEAKAKVDAKNKAAAQKAAKVKPTAKPTDDKKSKLAPDAKSAPPEPAPAKTLNSISPKKSAKASPAANKPKTAAASQPSPPPSEPWPFPRAQAGSPAAAYNATLEQAAEGQPAVKSQPVEEQPC